MKTCPECEALLNFAGDCGACGWQPKASKGKNGALQPNKPCQDCNELFLYWHSLTPGEDGRRRCASCHLVYLKARAEGPDTVCKEAGCTLTIREHIAQFKAYGAEIERRSLKL